MAAKRTVVIRWTIGNAPDAAWHHRALDVQEKIYWKELDGEPWVCDDPDSLGTVFRLRARTAANAADAERFILKLIVKNKVAEHATVERAYDEPSS